MPFNYLSLNDNISKKELLDNFDQLVNHCNTLEQRLNQVTSTSTSNSAANTEVVNARHPFATLSERLGASVFKPKYFKFDSYQLEENDDGEEVFSYEGLTFFNQEEIKVIGDGEVVLGGNDLYEPIADLVQTFLDEPYNNSLTNLEYYFSYRLTEFQNRQILDGLTRLLRPLVIEFLSGLIIYLIRNYSTIEEYRVRIVQLAYYIQFNRLNYRPFYYERVKTFINSFSEQNDTILAPFEENKATLLEDIIEIITLILEDDDSINEEQMNQSIESYREIFNSNFFPMLNRFLEKSSSGIDKIVSIINTLNISKHQFLLYYNETRERVEKSLLNYSTTKATFTPSENLYYPFAVITDFNGVNETKLHATSIPYDPKTSTYPTIVKTTSGEEVSYSLSGASDRVIVPYSNLEPTKPHVVLHGGGDIRSSYPVKVLLLQAIKGSPLFEKCGFLELSTSMKNANGEAFYQDCTDLPYQGAGLSRARLASSYPIHEERNFTLRQDYSIRFDQRTITGYHHTNTRKVSINTDRSASTIYDPTIFKESMMKVVLKHFSIINQNIKYQYDLEFFFLNEQFYFARNSNIRNNVDNAHFGYFSHSIQSNQASEQEVTTVLARLGSTSAVTPKAMSITFQNSYHQNRQVKFYLIYYADNLGTKLAIHMSHNLTAELERFARTSRQQSWDGNVAFETKFIITNQA